MDEKALNELLECSVCLDQLDDTSKVLPCQHTFCKRCLEEIVSTKHELRCPECRFLVEMRVEDLPSNILLIRLLEGLKSQSRVAGSQVPGRGKRDPVGSPGASKADNPNQTVAAFAKQQQQRQASTSNRPCAKALFNYDGKDQGDLSFKKGDVVYLRKQVDENWYHGELNGQHGFFPATYVQVITALPDTIPQCKGLYDFTVDDDKEEDCMPFKKDDLMTVIRRVDENWLEVKKGDKIGILPISFVELNDPAKILLRLTNKNKTETQSNNNDFTVPQFELHHEKAYIVHLGPAWIQMSLRKLRSLIRIHTLSHAMTVTETSSNSMDPDETVLMHRLVWIHAGCKCTIAIAATSSDPPVTPAHPVRAVKEGSPGSVSVVNKRHSLTTIPLTITTSANSLQRRSLDSTATDLLATGGQSVAMAAPLPATMTTELPVAMAPHLKPPANQAISVAPKKSETETPCVPSQIKPDNKILLDQSAGARPSGDVISTSLTASKTEDVATVNSGSSAPIYVALYNYKPQKGDELELIKGDYYSVSEKCLDGWYKGMALKTNTSGVFPGNYVQSVKTHTGTNKATSKSLVTKPRLPPPDQGLNGTSQSPMSPPRPKTRSSEAVGRSRTKPESHRRSVSGERNGAPPPIVPRSTQTFTPSASKGHPSSSSSPSSPILTTSKTTRYVRAAKSISPNIGAKSDTSCSASASSSVWKHSMSASANITPPNVVVGASANPAPAVVKEKEKKKDKEKLSLMKRLASAGKLKKPKSSDVESASLSDSSVSHSRSGSYPSDTSPLVAGEPNHKKSGSFDSSSPGTQHRPARPKPLPREKYRCVETYPAQSEIELDLKIGDIIYVHKKREDGWFKGTLTRSGKTGLFPGSFVEKVS